MKRILLVLSILFSIAACKSNTECGTAFIDSFNVDFVRFNNSGNLTNDPNRSVWDSIYALGATEAVYNVNDTVSSTFFVLPVNAQSDTVTYLFKKGEVWDTLSLSYIRGLRYQSPECGVFYQYRNLQIKYHSFDSAWVVADSLVRNVKNIEIIY